MRISHFLAQIGSFLLNKFFWYKPLLLLSSTYWPFSLCKIQKNVLQWIQSYEDAPFLDQKWSICPKKLFLEKTINIIFIYLLAPQNCWKVLTADPEIWGCTIFGSKMVHLPKWEFFFKKNPVNKPCSFHSCLSTYQKSKSDINLLMKYWRLKNNKISWKITWEPDFSQPCSFCRMLMNHKNFRFTQIPDKTNDAVFLNSPRTLFWDHFWSFLVTFAQWRFFPKNPAVTHNYIWAPNTMLSFRKN